MIKVSEVIKNSLPYIAYSFAAFIIFLILDLEFLAVAAFGFMIFCVYIFRNPLREYFSVEERNVMSPVDGTVVKVDNLNDYEYMYKIVIDSGYLDVSILRAPLNAKVNLLRMQRGTRVSKKSKLFYDLNENIALSLVDSAGHNIKIVHRLKQSFAPLMLDIPKNNELVKFSSYGVMLCGMTEIYLPKNFKFNIEAGTKVLASQTVLGHL